MQLSNLNNHLPPKATPIYSSSNLSKPRNAPFDTTVMDDNKVPAGKTDLSSTGKLAALACWYLQRKWRWLIEKFRYPKTNPLVSTVLGSSNPATDECDADNGAAEVVTWPTTQSTTTTTAGRHEELTFGIEVEMVVAGLPDDLDVYNAIVETMMKLPQTGKLNVESETWFDFMESRPDRSKFLVQKDASLVLLESSLHDSADQIMAVLMIVCSTSLWGVVLSVKLRASTHPPSSPRKLDELPSRSLS